MLLLLVVVGFFGNDANGSDQFGSIVRHVGRGAYSAGFSAGAGDVAAGKGGCHGEEDEERDVDADTE